MSVPILSNYPGMNPAYFEQSSTSPSLPAFNPENLASAEPTAPSQDIEYTDEKVLAKLKVEAWAKQVLGNNKVAEPVNHTPVQFKEYHAPATDYPKEVKKHFVIIPQVVKIPVIQVPSINISIVKNVNTPTPSNKNKTEVKNQDAAATTATTTNTATEDDNTALIALWTLALLVGTAVTSYCWKQYNNANERIKTVTDAQGKLESGYGPDQKLAKTFEHAMKMLNAAEEAAEWKTGLSLGMAVSAAVLVVGYSWVPAMIAIGKVAMVSTALAFAARTAWSWDDMAYPKEEGWMNWFPLTWVPKAEIAAAEKVLESLK